MTTNITREHPDILPKTPHMQHDKNSKIKQILSNQIN